MGHRRTILASGEIYHIFNRSVRTIPIFKTKWDYQLFFEAIEYYLQANPPIRFSIYRSHKNKYSIDFKKRTVTIINFCLMPTHFHFTLKQEMDNGIRQFIQRLSNSYAHYFNLKSQTKGPVFEGNFKAVRVETDEQLFHLSRYIHLNPVTSYLVEKPEFYLYSSYLTYIGKEKLTFVNPTLIMSNISKESYKKFVLDQKDYQRELDRIRHLLLE